MSIKPVLSQQDSHPQPHPQPQPEPQPEPDRLSLDLIQDLSSPVVTSSASLSPTSSSLPASSSGPMDRSKDQSILSDSNIPSSLSSSGKQNFLNRAKRNLVCKAATSGLGQALFKKMADDETLLLIQIFRDIVARYSSPQTGEYIQESIIRIFVKVLMLYDEKIIREDSFQELYSQFRKICALLKNTYWNFKVNNIKTRDIDEKTTNRIILKLQELRLSLAFLLTTHLQSGSLAILNDIFEFTANEKFIKFLFAEADFDKIVPILAYYLKHY